MTKITAIIPTLNEEDNIQRALDSVSFADEIIVIDSFSVDKTVEIISKNKGVKLLQRKFDDFSSQKNFAIQQAKHSWVLVLDADEELPKILQEEIKKTVDNPKDSVAFYIKRNFFYKGKKINFSGFRTSKVKRLFIKDKSKYEGVVHEELKCKGKVSFLKNKLKHYSFKNSEHYKQKLNHYAKLQAKELFSKDKKVTLFHIIIKPIVRFFIHYIIRFGFLDGIRGFQLSYLMGYGVYKRYLELLKLKYSNNITTNTNLLKIKIHNKKENLRKDVSIIIVNYKSWIHLRKCLYSLESINTRDFSFEIIVVDNFSNDGKLRGFLKEFNKTIFIENSGNNGFANGCNVGAKNSNGEYLLFLNPDAIASEDALLKMLKAAKESPNYGIISCSQINNSGKPEDAIRIFPNFLTLFGLSRSIYRKFNKEYKAIVSSKENTIFPNWVSGSTVFISTRWFEKIKGWNENYWMYYEDVDLCKKVSNLNAKVALLKDTQIIHNHGGASRLNVKTSALTKSEVLISRHIYVDTHFKGAKKSVSQFLLVLQIIFSKLILGILGFVLFFIPKLNVQWYLLVNMTTYYLSAIRNKTWLSKRSTQF